MILNCIIYIYDDLKFIYSKPRLYPNKIYKEYYLNNLNALYCKQVCLFMFNYEEIIETTAYYHNTRFNSSNGIISPKIRTNFNRFYLLYVFSKMCTTLKCNSSIGNNYIGTI